MAATAREADGIVRSETRASVPGQRRRDAMSQRRGRGSPVRRLEDEKGGAATASTHQDRRRRASPGDRDDDRRRRSRSRRREPRGRSDSRDRRRRRSSRDRARYRHRSRSRSPERRRRASGRWGSSSSGASDAPNKSETGTETAARQGPVVATAAAAAPPPQPEVTRAVGLLVHNEKPSNLPLNEPILVPRTGTIITAQMAVQQTMAAMSAKAQQLTGVTLPKYYNPAAVNPLKYAEQMQKRKLLWQSKDKKEASSTGSWENTTFLQDQDGKMAAKFRKLMGIKEDGAAVAAAATTTPPAAADDEHLRKQEELFRTLDKQYEVARISTHTQRGVGLGFASGAALQHPPPFPK